MLLTSGLTWLSQWIMQLHHWHGHIRQKKLNQFPNFLSRIFFYNPNDFAAGDGFGEICHMSEYSMVVDLITQEMITSWRSFGRLSHRRPADQHQTFTFQVIGTLIKQHLHMVVMMITILIIWLMLSHFQLQRTSILRKDFTFLQKVDLHLKCPQRFPTSSERIKSNKNHFRRPLLYHQLVCFSHNSMLLLLWHHPTMGSSFIIIVIKLLDKYSFFTNLEITKNLQTKRAAGGIILDINWCQGCVSMYP